MDSACSHTGRPWGGRRERKIYFAIAKKKSFQATMYEKRERFRHNSAFLHLSKSTRKEAISTHNKTASIAGQLCKRSDVTLFQTPPSAELPTRKYATLGRPSPAPMCTPLRKASPRLPARCQMSTIACKVPEAPWSTSARVTPGGVTDRQRSHYPLA